jgi:hypothetical protein
MGNGLGEIARISEAVAVISVKRDRDFLLLLRRVCTSCTSSLVPLVSPSVYRQSMKIHESLPRRGRERRRRLAWMPACSSGDMDWTRIIWVQYLAWEI